MSVEGNGRANSSMPVFPRLDRLDSLMKYLEGRQNPCSWSNLSTIRQGNRPSIPSESALRDLDTKGSILDRVSSLENRLFQLCLEIEASNASTSSMVRTFENASSRHISSTDQSLSFRSPDEHCLTYDDHSSCFHGALANRFEFLENPMTHSTEMSSQLKPLSATTSAESDRTLKGEKNCKKSRRRPWRRLLGC